MCNQSSDVVIQVESKCACEDGCVSTTPGQPSNLSPGTVVVIVLVSGVGLYIVLGTLYGKIVHQATG